MEEIVRAFNYVIEKGWVRRLLHYVTFLLAYTRVKALYWGTSEWSAHEIEEAHRKNNLSSSLFEGLNICADVASKLNLIAPIAEQCKHKYVIQNLPLNILTYSFGQYVRPRAPGKGVPVSYSLRISFFRDSPDVHLAVSTRSMALAPPHSPVWHFDFSQGR